MRRGFFMICGLILMCAVTSPSMANTTHTSITFQTFYESYGGIDTFGLPLTPPRTETIDGQPVVVQWYERARFELHGDQMQLGRLGADLLDAYGINWWTLPPGHPQPGCNYVEQTRHTLCGDFLTFWSAHPIPLHVYGLPISEPRWELHGGTHASVRLTQWFERARFELVDGRITLGLIGAELLSLRAPPPSDSGTQPTTPTPTPSAPQSRPTTQPDSTPGTGQPTPTPTLPPASFNNCQEDPYADAAPDYPVVITDVDKPAEEVFLQNVSDEIVDLTGWTMCSITGNQTHDGIAGTLAPGETRGFRYSGSGNIWNNEEQDDGALYTSQGQLVSYWHDPQQ